MAALKVPTLLLPCPFWGHPTTMWYISGLYTNGFWRGEKPQKRTVKIWNEDSIMALQGCFDCTSWEGFKCPDLNVQVEVISDYITFCVDSVLQTNIVKTYPNNKPWV